jgi:trimeric autotransporter adhesin
LVEVYDLSQAVLAKLANISTRAFVGTGGDIVIAGFILGGQNGNDRVVVRGIGPSLTAFGVPNALANPTLELRNSDGTLLVSNNDWQDIPAQAAELIAAGLALTNNLESGIATTLPPGLYTALLAGLNDGTGIGLVEVYDRGAP